MSRLETKITALLLEIIPKVMLREEFYQKWVSINYSQSRLFQYRDDEASLSISFQLGLGKFKESKTYQDAQLAFEADEVFESTPRTAGYWGAFDNILRHIFVSSSKIDNHKKISTTISLAIDELRKIRNLFKQQSLQFFARCKLLGVELKCKTLSLPEDVIIRRLTLKQLNERKPRISLFHSSDDHWVSSHRTDAEVVVTVPVNLSAEGAHFGALNEANRVASETLKDLVNTILLQYSGRCELGPIEVKGGIAGMEAGTTISRVNVSTREIKLGHSNLEELKASHAIIIGKQRKDKTLSRSVQRFLLGRKRLEPVDRLVDYVVVWESILLTLNGKAMDQELSYRFSVHGTILLKEILPRMVESEIFSKFRCAYRARSIIVHGGSDEELQEAIKRIGFENINQLNNFLEENFRRVVFWLSKKPLSERPYVAPEGWEKLLWKK